MSTITKFPIYTTSSLAFIVHGFNYLTIIKNKIDEIKEEDKENIKKWIEYFVSINLFEKSEEIDFNKLETIINSIQMAVIIHFNDFIRCLNNIISLQPNNSKKYNQICVLLSNLRFIRGINEKQRKLMRGLKPTI